MGMGRRWSRAGVALPRVPTAPSATPTAHAALLWFHMGEVAMHLPLQTAGMAIDLFVSTRAQEAGPEMGFGLDCGGDRGRRWDGLDEMVHPSVPHACRLSPAPPAHCAYILFESAQVLASGWPQPLT